MDSDDENLITYGTPIVTDDNEEEVPRKKPIPIEHQIVTDERGLRRFHGAFTGGFSAGYFNSVGSKEGWTPATFISSRSSRNDKNAQRPEDFMDAEDLGAFGIAPRGFRVNKKFTEDRTENKRKRPFLELNEGPIPGIALLKDLIVPVSESVGINLLRKMGWKPGQGIGPRLHLKEKLKKKQNKEAETSVKVYGCSLPNDNANEEVDENEDALHGITFAPDDVKIDLFTTKENWHGLGYVGLNKNPVLNTFKDGRRHALPFVDKNKKMAIAGEAFGVGAYEDDDESIYTVEDMSQYDFELGGDTNNLQTNTKEKNQQLVSMGYVRKELEGFHLSAKPLSSKKIYPPPVLPKNFQPFHKTCVEKQSTSCAADGGKHGLDRHRMTALERTVAISSETSPNTGSVFDHLRPEDRIRLQEIRKATAASSESANSPSSKFIDSYSPRLSATMGSGFKPFAQEADKQKRYELYLKLKESKKEEVFSKCQPVVMTEWEKQREQEEFRRAAVIYKPLAQSMASRFVSAKHSDTADQMTNEVVTTSKAVDNQQKATAAEREKFEWHPDRMLCRRFNIPNPYPDSSLVGIPKVKRDKYSIFNFLSAIETSSLPEDGTEESMAQSAIMNSPTKINEQEKINNEPPRENAITNLFSCLEARERDAATSKEPVVTKASPTSKIISSLEENESNPKVPEPSAEQIAEAAETVKPTMDLFKAIFCDTASETESSSDDMQEQECPTELNTKKISSQDATLKPPKLAESVKSQERTSDTLFGVFSNIDFDALNKKNHTPVASTEPKKLGSIAVKATLKPDISNAISSSMLENDCYYGPTLPPSLTQSSLTNAPNRTVTSSISSLPAKDESLVTRVHKKTKKHKHKKKHKRHSQKKYGRHSETSSNGDSSEECMDLDNRLNQRY